MIESTRRQSAAEARRVRRLEQKFAAQQKRIRELEEMCERQKTRIRELEKECAHDPLTGLLKSDGFEEKVLAHIQKIPHDKFGRDICSRCAGVVVFLDIDFFKQANDTLGHLAGDDILQILAGIVRGGDLAVRRTSAGTGDEFILFLAGMCEETAKNLLHSMRDRFEEAVQKKFPLIKFTVSFSFGVAEIPLAPDIVILTSVVHRAETFMYEDKKRRGGR